MTIAERLRFARERLGMSQETVAKAAGVSQGTIGNIESGQRKSPRELLAIAAAVGVTPDWLKTGKTGQTISSPPMHVAQPVSLYQVETVPSIAWEEIKVHGLPAKFETVIPDDSMAPRVRQGQAVTFQTDLAPRPGDGVLIEDADGNHYLRIYKQRRTGSWEAHAENDAYQALDSERDGLRVVGVLVAVHARWG